MKKIHNIIVLILLAGIFQSVSAQIPERVIVGTKISRLTTLQRDSLKTDNNEYAKGLMVYNLDTDCLNFWNGTNWQELCLSSPAADIEFQDCGRAYVYGSYYAGTSLISNQQYITIPVTAVTSGDYSIMAASNNGYYFQTNGSFSSPGQYNITLAGLGTPNSSQTDSLVITVNGNIIASCPIAVTVQPGTLSYIVIPNSIQPVGNYTVSTPMDNTDYVQIPIDVSSGGIAQFAVSPVSNNNNGVTFTLMPTTITGSTRDTLLLAASGTPAAAGTFTYSFTTNGANSATYQFSISYISTLGTLDSPAVRCADILAQNPSATDGEYWLQTGGTPQKCFCDMTDGGYTMIWSYSEQTAFNTYPPTGNVSLQDGIIGTLSNSTAPGRNPVITDAATITYNDWRLSYNDIQNVMSSATANIMVRIATDSTDMNDNWAANNYAILTPTETRSNPLTSASSGQYYCAGGPGAWSSTPPLGTVAGKLYGQDWLMNSTVRSLGPVSSGIDACMFQNGYPTHFNVNNSLPASTNITVGPTPPQPTATQTLDLHTLNNMFGYYGAEPQPNHHFGKCISAAADDYDFSTPSCTQLYPHSFNGGQGRYCQWFVK